MIRSASKENFTVGAGDRPKPRASYRITRQDAVSGQHRFPDSRVADTRMQQDKRRTAASAVVGAWGNRELQGHVSA